MASNLAPQSGNSQHQQDQQPTQNLADNQVVGSNGELIDLGKTFDNSINK